MKELEEILLGGMFRPTEQNCPTREGELIGSLDKIHDIPNPRVGMRVYVENTGKEYVIKSLKDKTIGGVNVPNAAVGKFEEVVNREDVQEMFDEIATESTNRLNADNTIKASALKLEQSVNTTTDKVTIKGCSVDAKKEYSFYIPSATKEKAGVMSAEDQKKLDAAGATKVTWGNASNMNDYRTAGVYDIYGERTRQDDNLPILNASSGHSIAARLTVVASTLQPANNEICVTQFLQLSNRIGGEGTTYVRTYNENNNGMNGWSPWQKQIGMVETLINGDDVTVGQEIFSQGSGNKIGNGINGMIDNGMYSGIYIDNLSYTGTSKIYYLSAQPTFVETFVLIVINDYAVSGQAGLPRHITQLKYAVDAITGQSTVKKRIGTGNDAISWSDWTDIGGGGSQEIDITDAVKAYGLPTLVEQGYIKEGVTYVAHILNKDLSDKTIVFDKQGKLADFFQTKYVVSPAGATIKFNYSLLKGDEGYNSDNRVVSGIFLLDGGKYEFYINIDLNRAFVSADMTTL